MRRTILFSLLVAGTILAGCSSTSDGEASQSSSTTTSSVLVSATNKDVCGGLEKMSQLMNDAVAGRSSDANEQKVQAVALFTSIDAALADAQKSAPSDILQTIADYRAGIASVVGADPNDPAVSARLVVLLFSQDAAVAEAQQKLGSWAQVNCGVTIPAS